MSKEIIEKAKSLLKDKQVDLVIGYKRGPDGTSAVPAFVYDEKAAEDLIWDERCVYNLSTYLRDFTGKKIGIIAKACDVKSTIVLMQENQVKREDLVIIGVECSGVINEKKLGFNNGENKRADFDEKCKTCDPAAPSECDVLIKQEDEKKKTQDAQEDPYEAVLKLEAKSSQERFRFWQEELSRCIRCHACRQICPSCYCPTCVADQIKPAWFSKTTSLEGNFAWNVNRAIHLTGRCTDCGECERACPVGIPLRGINKKIEKDIKELFDFETGQSIEQEPLFSTFREDDPEDFIK